MLDVARGEFARDFEEALAHRVGELLVTDSVILEPAWHGLGLGPVLAGTAKLARVWSTVGFEPFQHGVHFLACHLQRPP
ncbi:hypothetical protein ACWDB3_30495 [Streptomyces bacillaris]